MNFAPVKIQGHMMHGTEKILRTPLAAILLLVALVAGSLVSAGKQLSPGSLMIAGNPFLSMTVEQSRAYIDSLKSASNIGSAADEFGDLVTAQSGGLLIAADIIQSSPYGCANTKTTTALFAELVETKRTYVIDRVIGAVGPGNARDTLRSALAAIVKKYADTLSPYGKDIADPVRNSTNVFRALAFDPNDGKLLPFASVTVRSNRDFAYTAVQTMVSNLQIIPPSCGFYPLLVDYAVGLSASALRYVTDKTFDGYADIALRAVKINWQMLEYVPKSTLNYFDICLAAIKITPNALQYVDREFPSYLQLAMNAVGRDGLALSYVPADLLTPANKGLVLAAVRQNGLALAYAGSLISDTDVILAALKQNPKAYIYVSSDNPDFWLFVFLNLYDAWKDIPGDIKTSEYFQLQLVQSNLNYYAACYETGTLKPASDSVKHVAAAMRAAFATLKIYHYVDWFNSHKEILRNRYAVSAPAVRLRLDSLLGAEYFKRTAPDARPLCLMVYADDPDYPNPDEIEMLLTRSGYRLLFYDASTDTEFRDDFLEATINAGTKADVLLTGGHGTQLVLRLGLDGSDYLHANERYVDVTDSFLVCLRNGVHKNGRIIMHACDNGSYRNGKTPGIDNLAEFFHFIWPQAYVYAGNFAISNINVALDTAGLFSGVQFRELPSGAEPGFYDDGLVLPPEDIPEGMETVHAPAIALQSFPNPFSNESVSIRYTLEKVAAVSFQIFNECGVCIERSSEITGARGEHEYHFDGARFPAGTYYFVLRADGATEAVRLMKVW
jgi:hypothetical protein